MEIIAEDWERLQLGVLRSIGMSSVRERLGMSSVWERLQLGVLRSIGTLFLVQAFLPTLKLS